MPYIQNNRETNMLVVFLRNSSVFNEVQHPKELILATRPPKSHIKLTFISCRDIKYEDNEGAHSTGHYLASSSLFWFKLLHYYYCITTNVKVFLKACQLWNVNNNIVFFVFRNYNVSLLFPLTCTCTCGTIMPENNNWSWCCFIRHLFTLCAQFGFPLVCNGKALRAVNRGQALWAGEEGVQYWPLLVATVHCSLQVR